MTSKGLRMSFLKTCPGLLLVLGIRQRKALMCMCVVCRVVLGIESRVIYASQALSQ